METSTVILGIIIVGAVVGAISYSVTRKGISRNLEEKKS